MVEMPAEHLKAKKKITQVFLISEIYKNFWVVQKSGERDEIRFFSD